jgi:putative peptidoglycan lipid II flippase
MALSTAAFPRLADQAADEDLEALTATVSRVLRVIMFLTVPAALGLAMLREPATVVLLERGEFLRGDSLITAAALGWYCLGIVPQAGIEIHSRGFYALGDTRTPVATAIAAVALNLALSAVLWSEYGTEGLAFAVSAAAWLEWSALYWLYERRTGAELWGDLEEIAAISVCGAAMALFLAIALVGFDIESRADHALVAVSGAVAGAAFYAGMARLLRVEELEEATARISVRFR